VRPVRLRVTLSPPPPNPRPTVSSVRQTAAAFASTGHPVQHFERIDDLCIDKRSSDIGRDTHTVSTGPSVLDDLSRNVI
jgi:hypothetical protein